MTMRIPISFFLPVLALFGLMDWYICRAVWRRCTENTGLWRKTAVWSSVILAFVLIVLAAWPKRDLSDSVLSVVMWILYGYLTIYIPKAVFIALDLLSKIPQLWNGKRWLRTSLCAAAGGAVFCFLWWGALVERFQTDIKTVEIARNDIPAGFDGMTIAQISDLHLGTFGSDTTFISSIVDEVNSLNPDIIVFTGDIVNRHSSEMEPFVPVLGRLRAPLGIYSILGNHDYGDYCRWENQDRKIENMALMYHLQQQAGWRMLNNNTDFICAGTDTLALIGVENIGDPPFPIYGDLETAYPGDLADPLFKILLSHNPAHWDSDIKEAPDKNIALTLSGHTHAMQIKILGWSPASWRYPEWGGLYADSDSAHLLYVNTGIGEVGIPARIGATPEITLITLKKR